MSARLIVEKGPLLGLVLVLEDGASWSIGSDNTLSDILIDDPKIADTQIVIRKEGDLFYVTNADTSIPVTLNGQPVTEKTVINDEDVLVFGDNQYSFSTHEFDSEDVIFEITSPSENPANVSSETADSKKKTSQANMTTNSSSDNAPTDKDQELADAFLAAAKAEKGKAGQTDQEISIGEETKDNAAPKDEVKKEESPVSKENSETSPSDQQETPTPSQDASEHKEEEKKEEQSQQEEAKKEESDQPATEAKEASAEQPEQAETPSEEKQEEGEQAEEDQQEDKEEGQHEDKEEADKEEQPVHEKVEVLSPFNVQDLFRFDQGIFPAEMDSVAQKSVAVDLSQPSRFLLKVLAGANIGAEFHLDTGKTYVLGDDPEAADIVFNDLSVSHRHAKLIVGNDGSVMIEDLGSKNGVIVEGKKVEHNSTLSPNQVVALGTTLFLLIDHMAPADTIVASFAPEDYGLFGRPQDAEEMAEYAAQEEEEKRKRATLPTGSFILTMFIGGLAILFGVGTASLFHTKEVIPIENIHYQDEIERVVKQFPTVRFTFNKNNGQLFLIGHVKNGIDKSELLYKMDALTFIKSIDDNIIDDEAVWQEANILLSKKPEFKGVSMHSPEPGKFVMTGYLKTEEQAANLSEYLNLHFNYPSLLENKVIIEMQMLRAISGQLLQAGFANIQVGFVNGEAILTGYVAHDDGDKFRSVVQSIAELPGVRVVKNFVVLLPVEEGVIDLNLRYPGRYRVTGSSKYGDLSINVVINGRILTRGDVIDGMTITSIQPNCIFLEKEELKYKIEYNK